MNILRVSSKSNQQTQPRVTVAFTLPEEIASYLSLYAIEHGVTRSYILRELIKDWYKERIAYYPPEKLLVTVMNYITNLWSDRGKSELTTHEFREQLRHDLERKGVPEKYIHVIFEKINEL